MARARTLTLKTQVEVKGLDKLNNLGKKLQSTGKALTVGVTLPLVAAGVAAFKFASDLEESTSKAETVFGDAVGGIRKEAGSLTDAFSEAQFLDFAGTFGAIATAMGATQQESADLSLQWISMAQDFASFNNLGVEDTLLAIRSALTGEFEPLKRMGVVLNQAKVEAEALALGLWDGTGALDAFAKAQAVTSIIQREAAVQMGDFERTAEGAANSTKILMANAIDAAAALGQELLPAGIAILTMANDWVRAFKELNPETRQWVIRIAAAAAAIGPILFVVGKLLSSIKLLVAAGGALRFAFLHIPTALGFVDLAFAKTAAASKVLLASLGPLGLIAALGAAALAIDGFVDRALSPLSKGFREAAESTGADVILLEKQVQGLADDLDISFSEAEDRVAEYAERTGRSYQDAVDAVKRGVKAMTDEQWDAVEDAGNAWAAHQNVISDALYGSGGMVPTITQGADDMAAEMGEAPGKMADELLAAQQELSDATTQLVNFMEQALSPAQEKFRLQGFLSSKELAEGLASGNPLVRQKAGELAEAARARLAELNGYGSGYAFASSFADGISAGAWRAVNVTSAMAARVMGIMPRSEPKDPNSPFRGITKGWGFMETLAAGLASSSDVVTRTLANALTTPRLATSLAAGSTVPLPGGGGMTIINNFYLQWDGEPPRGRDEAEIIANLQRLSPLLGGKLAPGY